MGKIRILSWNVNGIRAVHKKGFLEWFKSEKPDILCIQETKATRKQFPKDIINVDDYKLYISEAIEERLQWNGYLLPHRT